MITRRKYSSEAERRAGLLASKKKYRLSMKGQTQYKRSGQRSADLKRLYGISLEQEQEMLQDQNGQCALCPATAGLGVDHDHHTGRVRGILCFKCNTAIGKLGDNETGLLRALSYLRAPWQM